MSLPYQCTVDMFDISHDVTCLTVELDGIEFSGSGPSMDGFGLTGWSGWLNGADARGGAVPYETADGGFETRVDMSGRTITLEGLVVAGSKQQLWERCDRLAKVCTGKRWAPLVVNEEALGLSRMMNVWRPRAPQITFREERRSAVFTLELQSANYPKLDVERQELPLKNGQSGAVTNDGDYPAELLADLVGPLYKPTLKWAGGSWTFNGYVPFGSTYRVDFTRRTISDSATAKGFRILASGTWPSIPPESSLNMSLSLDTSQAATGTVNLLWRSAWN